jgi:hypothetical protein
MSADDPDFTDSELIAVANRVMERRFVPLIRKVRADYYVTWEDQDIVADQQDYRIPVRSTTNSVRNVVWVDDTGRERVLDPVALTDRHMYATTRGYPTAYAVQDDYLVLLPAPSAATGTLRVYFERRPSTLILIDPGEPEVTPPSTVRITDFALNDPPTTGLVTFDGDASSFEDVPVDVVRHKPPFSLAIRDGEYTTPFLLQVLSLNSWDRAPEAGDFLCLSGETPIPQIPPEMHPLLALATAAEAIRPLDAQAAGLLMVDYQDGMNEAVKLLQPRQQGRQQKLKNTSSMLRRGMRVVGGGTFSDWE